MVEGVQFPVMLKPVHAPPQARAQYIAKNALERAVPNPTFAHIFSAPA